MFVNSTGNLTEARKQAQANANYTGVPWAIYKDTSGNVRICRYSQRPDQYVEVVRVKRNSRTGER